MTLCKILIALAATVVVGGTEAQAMDISPADRAAIAAILTAEEAAWKAGDAAAFAAPTTADVVFTNIIGLFSVGRAPFVAQHARIFATIYKGSAMTQTVEHIALIRPDVAVVDTVTSVSGFASVPPGTATADGVLRTRLEQVMVRGDHGWSVAAFHNVTINQAAIDRNSPPKVTDLLAIYIHWPFCVSKCPYCDFNSHVRASIDEAGWRTALLADLAHEAALTRGRTVGSIFFGGGTPSLMDPATVAAVIDAVARHWPVDAACEITLEANPSSVEAARFAGFARAGVNRVSLGLQALDDAALAALGRPHDLAQGLAALDVAQANFPRVSVDLIYDRPGQTVAAWQSELSRALGFGTEHLSLYQLTIEDGTRYATLHARGDLVLPHEDVSADLFDLTQAITEAAGIPAYEVSNHARAGAASRHNLAYWTYADYVGVGPGAHGRRAGAATVRHKKPENWTKSVAAHGHGIAATHDLPPPVRAGEALLMGLRLADGIDAATFAARTGQALDDSLDRARLARLVEQKFVERDDAGLRLTRKGRPLVNAVLAELA